MLLIKESQSLYDQMFCQLRFLVKKETIMELELFNQFNKNYYEYDSKFR